MLHYQLADQVSTTPSVPCTVCTNITDSLRDIDESEPDTYEQLKTLLMSRRTKACWTRAFELLKYPELGDMKPTNLMRQMKALLPTDSRPCTHVHGHIPPLPAAKASSAAWKAAADGHSSFLGPPQRASVRVAECGRCRVNDCKSSP
jgi:hypothetical protein